MDWFDVAVLSLCGVGLVVTAVLSIPVRVWRRWGMDTRSRMEAKPRRMGDVWGHEDWMCFEGMCFKSSAFLARWRLICILATDRVRARP